MAPPELYGAAFYGDAERVRALLEAGADPGARDDDGDTPLHAAALHGYLLCELYLAYTRSPRDGYDQDYEEDEDEDGDGAGRAPLPPPGAYFEVVKALLAGGADPCAANKDGVTPLHMAALWDHAAELQALLAAGADAGAADADGRTPLHLAAEGDAHRAVRLLLAAGADPAARDLAGRTALDLSEDAPLRQLLAPKRPWAGIAAIALPISILALYTFLIL
ncbi:hypothetical protein R5R35_007231 [Gryllus longicercus]